MDLKSTFRDQLRYQAELGASFARQYPQLARYLGDTATDPDVERLLEGFAFLSARVEMKLTDDFPEITQSLLRILQPNYLRPVPSSTMLQFTPIAGAVSRRQVVARGTQVASRPVDGTPCLFRTCMDLPIYPFHLARIDATYSQRSSVVNLHLQTLARAAPSSYDCDALTFHFGGDTYRARTLYLWFSRYLAGIRMHGASGSVSLDTRHIAFPGFERDDALAPYPAHAMDSYRILQEYLAFPQRFMFFRLGGLAPHWPTEPTESIRLEFVFSRPMPADIQVSNEDIALHCVPAVNLFAHDGEPIDYTGTRTEYPLRPAGDTPASHEIFSVDGIESWSEDDRAKGTSRIYHPFESFHHQMDHEAGEETLYYRLRAFAAVHHHGFEHAVAFVRSDDHRHVGRSETVCASLTCTNRDLPAQLAAGDISGSPDANLPHVSCRNIVAPTPTWRPSLDGDLLWPLISNLSPSYLSLLSIDSLRAILRTYDFPACHDLQRARITQRKLDGMRRMTSTPIDRFYKGLPVRGTRTVLELDQDAFGSEGELYLFGTVLSHFFGLYASIASFHQLEVIDTVNRERHVWPMRSGTQPMI